MTVMKNEQSDGADADATNNKSGHQRSRNRFSSIQPIRRRSTEIFTTKEVDRLESSTSFIYVQGLDLPVDCRPLPRKVRPARLHQMESTSQRQSEG